MPYNVDVAAFHEYELGDDDAKYEIEGYESVCKDKEGSGT